MEQPSLGTVNSRLVEPIERRNPIEDKVNRFIWDLNKNAETTVLSYGLGVDSTAVLLRWLFEPDTRPCDLSRLIVITSMVGNEWPDTYRDVTKYILPLLREYKVRFVQLARAGHSESDGIVVLDDSTRPEYLYGAGVYTLSTELGNAGTVPQFGGEHRCSLKFKAFVVDSWLEDNVRVPARHAFGYNADEPRRVEKSEAAFKERIAFGYNAEEMSRVVKARKYNTPSRVGFYPLVEWGWGRQTCVDYIRSKLDVLWQKSACFFCPFSHNKQSLPDLVARQLAYPDDVSKALMLEHMSLSLNPRGVLYSNGALIDLIRETDNKRALVSFNQKLTSVPWTVYRVRRIYTKKGKAHRAVETSMEMTREDALAELLTIAGEVEVQRGINYVYQKHRVEQYPCREEYYVTAPMLVPTKTRSGLPNFNARWSALDYEQTSLWGEDATDGDTYADVCSNNA
jgi:hypothetical protein